MFNQISSIPNEGGLMLDTKDKCIYKYICVYK